MTFPYDFDTRGIRALPHQLRLRGLLRRLHQHDFSFGSYADVGCGDGFVTSHVMRVTKAGTCDGFDHNATFMGKGQRTHSSIRFIQYDLNADVDVPYRYDFVTCFETMEHVVNLEVAVKNLLNMTRPGGLLILTVPIEVGLVGTTKFLAKTLLWQDRLTEAFVSYPGMHREYLKALVLDRDISRFRDQGNTLGYWPGHWGFDYRKMELLFKQHGARVRSERFLISRYFEVRP